MLTAKKASRYTAALTFGATRMSNTPTQMILTLTKSTKNKHVYGDLSPAQDAPIDAVYVSRTAMPSSTPPQKIKLTFEIVE